jgi:hypothetical protein
MVKHTGNPMNANLNAHQLDIANGLTNQRVFTILMDQLPIHQTLTGLQVQTATPARTRLAALHSLNAAGMTTRETLQNLSSLPHSAIQLR